MRKIEPVRRIVKKLNSFTINGLTFARKIDNHVSLFPRRGGAGNPKPHASIRSTFNCFASQFSMSVDQYSSVVILTGAGISAESGLKTFRASDGLWEEHRIEDVASPEGFERDPALVHNFYNLRRRALLDPAIKPNAAHLALAEFEQRFAGEYLLVTQNIDNLHERAGSRNIRHMHGEALKIRCSSSGQLFDCNNDIDVETSCPCCGLKGQLRPHVVWFGEMPLYMDEIYATLNNCDLFIAIGTSGNVYPAAGFFEVARHAGAHTVELNLEPSTNGSSFGAAQYGPATVLVPEFLKRL